MARQYVLVTKTSGRDTDLIIREYQKEDLPFMTEIWNEVVFCGNAFPQTEPLASINEAEAFFSGQSFTGVAQEDGQLLGLYILHPNNVGRCGHICNASFAVKASARGKRIGEKLVLHCMEKGKELGFHILQFNAVVRTNDGALHLYKKLGFVELGIVPGGFLMKDGSYEDIALFYHTL